MDKTIIAPIVELLLVITASGWLFGMRSKVSTILAGILVTLGGLAIFAIVYKFYSYKADEQALSLIIVSIVYFLVGMIVSWRKTATGKLSLIGGTVAVLSLVFMLALLVRNILEIPVV